MDRRSLAADRHGILRRRRLPAERMVWLVIGLALFHNEPIWHIVQQLDLADGPASSAPVPSAAVAGRERLGEAPMAWLFGRLASCWGSHCVPERGLFHGLRNYAVDGVVCLMDTYTHLIRAAEFGDYRTGELSFAKSLMNAVPDDSPTIFDRAYFSAAFLLDWQQSGHQRHWLMRARKGLRHEAVRQFAPDDYLVRLPVSPEARQQRPELPSRSREQQHCAASCRSCSNVSHGYVSRPSPISCLSAGYALTHKPSNPTEPHTQ